MATRYQTLVFPKTHKPLHDGYLKHLPKFCARGLITVDAHIMALRDFTNDSIVEYEDIFIHIFVYSLEGDSRSWFGNLSTNTVST
jgi:hypothetical protein